jgi:hypothetical protein
MEALTMFKKKSEVEEIKDVPVQDTFNAEDMSITSDEEE